jgi:MFS transporter, ACS family, aldohexuronate transporter
MQHLSPAALAPPTSARRAIPQLRWIVCGLLFVATTINYVDRQTVPVLNKEVLQRVIGWDDIGYSWIMFAFQISYAVMFSVSGRLLDRFGVRVGMIWAVVVWSLAAIGHACARSTLGFAVARFCLGLGEAANFPASVKAVAEWFPRRERAFANGVFNSGTNFGVILSIAIVWLSGRFGWQAAFVITGALGFLWLALWLRLYRAPHEHPRLSAEEHAHIVSDAEDAVVPGRAAVIPWTALLRYRQAWAFFLAKLLTDPVWWFYLYWLPSYLAKERGVTGLNNAKTLILPYFAAIVGGLCSGRLSGYLIKRGWSTGRARLTVMAVCAAGMPAAIGAVFARDFGTAKALITLAMGCHQAWGAILFTLPSDMFPKRAVGSVVGLGSTCGAIGGMFMTLVAGGMLQWLGSFTPLFVIAGVMHLFAWALILALAGRKFAPADLERDVSARRSPVLAGAGVALALLGTALVALVATNWQLIVAATRSPSTATAGLVASAGAAAIGGVLIYASRARPSAQR